ncbi:hypothetical protein ROU88_08350 [Macrococcus capreoli]
MIIENTINWEALSAISTFAAVIVAVLLPYYNSREKRRLSIKSVIQTDYSYSRIKLCVTIDNIGNRNIVIDSIGFKSNNDIDMTYNRLLKDIELPLKININDSKVIIFEYQHNDVLSEENEDNIEIIKIFKTKEIVIADSLYNKYYQTKSKNNLLKRV